MKKNILANFIGRFWSVLSNFIFVPLYINILGLESYSIISFTLVLNGIMAMMDAGLTATLSREFASSINSSSDKLRSYKTLESCYFMISIFVIILLLSVSEPIAFNWLKLDNIPRENVSFYLKIISIEIGLRLIGQFYAGGLIGLEKQIKSNIYQVGYGAIRNGLVIIAIIIHPSLNTFFIWQAITTFVYVIAIRFDLNFSLTHSNRLFFSRPRIEKQVLSKVWRFAGGMMLISMVAGLNTQMDKLALSKLLPIEVLGLYTLAFALSSGLSFISSPVSTAILPRMTSLFTSGNKEEATKLFKSSYQFVSIIIFSFAAAMMFFAKELIWVWTNNHDLADKAYIFVIWIAGGTSFLALQNLPFNVAIANGYTKFNNIIGLSSLIVTLPGYWILTKLYGGIGAAITYSTVQILIGLLYLFLVNKKFMQLNSSTLYLKNYLLPIIISTGTTLITHNIVNIEENRIIILLKIGSIVTCSLIANTLFLVPHKTLSIEIQKKRKFKKK